MMQLDGESGLGRALERFRPLCGKRVALLEADGLDLERLATLREAFARAGAEVVVVSPSAELRQSSDGARVQADTCLRDTSPEVYHALCIPGAAGAVVALRSSAEARDFVRSFARTGKWIATLDHGPLLLEDIGITTGKTVTSDPSLRAELEQGGAVWVSDAVIADHQLVTAQGEAQLEAFVRIASLRFQEKRSDPPPGYH
jgi:protease I